MNWRAPPQRSRRSLLFGRALRLRLLRFVLRLWVRPGGGHGLMSGARFYMGSAPGVLNRRLRRRIRPSWNNAFDSIAAGTSGEEGYERRHCNDAHHDIGPGKGARAMRTKLDGLAAQPPVAGIARPKVPCSSRKILTLPDPDRFLRSGARCALRWLRARNVLIFHAGEMLPSGIYLMHRAIGQLAGPNSEGRHHENCSEHDSLSRFHVPARGHT